MLISKNKRKRITLTALAMVVPSGLTACHPQPPSDKTGQAIDQAARMPEQAVVRPMQDVDRPLAADAEKTAAGGNTAADAELAARVKAALLAEPSIRGSAIDVNSNDGAVTLFGTVDRLAQRDKLTQVASAVAGVRAVLNNVKIISGS